MKRYLLFAAILMAAVSLCRADSDKAPMIEVKGSATINIVPDLITIEIGMEEYYRQQAAEDSVIVRIPEIERGVRQVLREAGIPDSLTVVSDLGNYRNRNVSQTFLLAKRLSATVSDFDQIDRISDRLDRNGIVSFNIIKTDNTDMARFNRMGLKAALDAARQKAEFIADNEGLKLIMPYKVTETTNDGAAYSGVSNVAYDSGAGMENMRRIVRRYSVTVRYLSKLK